MGDYARNALKRNVGFNSGLDPKETFSASSQAKKEVCCLALEASEAELEGQEDAGVRHCGAALTFHK